MGGSIGLDRLVSLLLEINADAAKALQGSKVYVAIASEDARGYGFEVAQQLRDAGLNVDINMKEQKLAAQIKFALRVGAQHVCVIGSDEAQAGTVTLKDLSKNEQKLVERNNLLTELK